VRASTSFRNEINQVPLLILTLSEAWLLSWERNVVSDLYHLALLGIDLKFLEDRTDKSLDGVTLDSPGVKSRLRPLTVYL
jgi:hypothetical protein